MAETCFSAPGFQPVAQLLTHYAQTHPDKAALVDVDNGQHLHFKALEQAVQRSARTLTMAGIQAQDRVILTGENSIAKIILWLAIWRLGAVVCPLDPGFIRTTINTVIHSIQPKLVLAGTPSELDLHLEWFPDTVRTIVYWDTLESGVVMLDDQTLERGFEIPIVADDTSKISLHDLACIACTSGTTGQPKVVLYDYAALWLNGLDSISLLALTPNDRMLEYRSLNWYSSQILSLMPFLQTGLTLHLARRFSLRRFGHWVQTHQLTISVGVPTVIQLLLKEPLRKPQKALASLRLMTSSTAPLASQHWQAFEALYECPLVNLYGSTETGWISGNHVHDRKYGTVGRVLSSVKIRLNAGKKMPGDAPALQPFMVETPKIAVGYLSNNGTLQPLRNKPFLMRDAARLDASGYLHVWGRTDDLVIRGGVKISPIEIEATISAHPRVQEVAIIGLPDDLYGMQSVCFFVPNQHQQTHTAWLVHYCQQKLPLEKMPQHFIPLAHLPRNSRGKILKTYLVSLAKKLLGHPPKKHG